MQPPFVVREFEVSSNGKVIGAATTSWLLLDMETRRPLKRGVAELEANFRTDYRLPFDAPKIELSQELVELTKFQVRNSDLDMNEHVNNTRYAQWVLDSIPLDWHHRFQLHEYEVNFLAETRANDVITIQKKSGPIDERGPLWAEFQGLREADQKIVFSARLLVSAVDATLR
jgi:acyl-ACP thioesterase